VLLAELLNKSCCGFFTSEATAHIIYVFIFQVVTGTYVTMWLLLGSVLHFLKVLACSYRENVSSSA